MEQRIFKKEDYISFNPITNKTTCLLCQKTLTGLLVGNIKRHYERVHDISFLKRHRTTFLQANLGPQQTKSEKEEAKEDVDNNAGTAAKTTRRLMSSSEFIKCCVGLVTVKNLPLRIFDDMEFFKQLIGPYEEEFNINLNSHKILDSISMWTARIKSSLKSKFHQRMLSINIDVASRMKKNIMLVNVHFINRNKCLAYTIGTVQLKSKIKTRYLKEEIRKCLQEFDIDMRQIYSITGDNREYVSNALNMLQQELEDKHYENAMSEGNEDEDFKCSLFILRSGYHILKLVAAEFFPTIEENLQKIRDLVLIIKDNYVECTENGIEMPTLDNNIHFESTYNMIKTLKEYVTIYKLDLKVEWQFIENFMEAFAPLIDCAQKLDKQEYIIGDFYRDWLVAEAKLRKMKQNPLAADILTIMYNLKQSMLYNDAFNAALYYDPRFNYLDSPYFNDERKRLAVDHILKIHAISLDIRTSQPAAQLDSDDVEIENETTTSLWTEEDPYNILEEELHSMSKNNSNAQENLSLRQKLENLPYTQRQAFSTNILDYWKIRPTYDEAFEQIFKVIQAVPINRSLIERTKQALTTVLTKQKSNIVAKDLQNILLVKLNENILKSVDE